MISEFDIYQHEKQLRGELIKAAVRYNFGIKFMENGGVAEASAYYKAVQHIDDPQDVKLVAVVDPDALTGREIEGEKHLFLAFPGESREEVRVVEEFEHEEAELPAAIHAAILSDRLRLHVFMRDMGNLLEIPLGQEALKARYFKNGFARYFACPIQKEDGTTAYDIYAYFNTEKNDKKKSARQLEKMKSADALKYIKKHGLYLTHLKSGPEKIEKYIHRDFCKRFSRFLEAKNPIMIADVRKSFLHCAVMILANKLTSSEIGGLKYELDTYLKTLEWARTMFTYDSLFPLVSEGWKLAKRL